MAESPSPPALRDHALSLQDVADRAASRQSPARMASFEQPEQLPGAPARMEPAGLEQRLDYLGWGLGGAMLRSAGPIGQPLNSVLLKPLQPLVASLATDAVSLAQVGHGEGSKLIVVDEASALAHG
jgi:hypothetical protein